MKISIILLASFGLVFSVNATTVIPMKGVSILYINGQETKSKISSSEVEPGETQLVVRMDKKVGRGSSQTVYTSAPYVLTFNVTGEEVKINHPVARSKQEAEAVFRQSEPEWRISQDGESLIYSQEKLKGREGLLPYMGVDELVAKHNQARGISFGTKGATVPSAAATSAVVATSASSAADKANAEINASNIDQLQALYLKASKAERKEFRKWMIDQE